MTWTEIDQDWGFDSDVGIRPLRFYVTHASDISAYTFTIYGKNFADGTTDDWTGTASYASGVLTIVTTPSTALTAGEWEFYIKAASGTNYMMIGPFPGNGNRIEIKEDEHD